MAESTSFIDILMECCIIWEKEQNVNTLVNFHTVFFMIEYCFNYGTLSRPQGYIWITIIPLNEMKVQ